ncbi:MAG: serine hydroxymethyltransferase [Planctomycetes bacterium SM23_32]|nr:MAG: serine hydroxymethyltransferase [Planctomycetes bacterium SM23_32]
MDPEVAEAIEAESRRQQEHLDLIASENHCSGVVMEVTGSVLTDKYAEGYPGARYYGGCECVDAVEKMAVERAKRLFGAEHANVQPHAGSQANMGVYMAMLSPGASILGMALAHGGHLTHGHSRNFSGQLYEVVSYGVTASDGLLDYEEVRRLAVQHNPALIIAGASAYSRTIDFEAFRDIADEVGAYLLADIAHIAGLVAAGVHPSPVPHADFVTSTTHKTLRGPRGAFILCREEYAPRIDAAVMPGIQGGPFMHAIAAKAVAFKLAMEPEFRLYQEQVVANARAMAEEFIRRGLPVVSGGTDTHMFLIDLTSNGLSGEDALQLLARANITVNKNAIPNDPRKPSEASGIRIGTPAVTTRGMAEDEMRTIAGWVVDVICADDPEAMAEALRPRVMELCAAFPVRH